MASSNITKQEALSELWVLAQQKPRLRTAILDKLTNEFGVSVDEFIAYDSTMNRAANIDILEERAEELADIPGFSQKIDISDKEILRIFEARDALDAKIEDIGRPPTEAEWYKAGRTAEERIARLRPAYENWKAEEWEQLEYPSDIIAPFMGPIGAVTEVVAGWMDWMPGIASDFGEQLHERGFGTSWNPLTGFGAWDIAEFKVDPQTGQRGLSQELLAIEEDLNILYGTKRQYEEKMIEGGYRDQYKLQEEMGSLNQIIMEQQLLDPRILGER